MFVPKTQKARGLTALALFSPSYRDLVPAFSVYDSEEGLERLSKLFTTHPGWEAIFARPCPPRPVHGGVESRLVPTLEAAKNVWREANEFQPNSEVMLSYKIPAVASFVWTPGQIVVGEGHDGATSGSSTLTLPCMGVSLDPRLLKAAGIGENEAPYVEGVQPSAHHTLPANLVQLRAGPPSSFSSPNFIPKMMEVKKKVKAEGDLIEWRNTLDLIKDLEGVVVDHCGGSLLSHYSVSAIQAGVAVITTHHPQIGDLLIPPSTTEEKTAINFDQIARGIIAGIAAATSTPIDIPTFTSLMCRAGLFSLHHISAVMERDPLLAGAGIGFLYLLGITACLGEYRYYTKTSKSREQVYHTAIQSPFSERLYLPEAFKRFREEDRGGVGGVRWAECLRLTIKVENALLDFVKAPTEKAWGELVNETNIMINAAHNGGWWFNKFGSEALFQAISGDVLEGIAYTAYATFYMRKVVEKTVSSQESRVETIGGLLLDCKRSTISVEPIKPVLVRASNVIPDFSSHTLTVFARKKSWARFAITEEEEKKIVEGVLAAGASPILTLVHTFDTEQSSEPLAISIVGGLGSVVKVQGTLLEYGVDPDVQLKEITHLGAVINSILNQAFYLPDTLTPRVCEECFRVFFTPSGEKKCLRCDPFSGAMQCTCCAAPFTRLFIIPETVCENTFSGAKFCLQCFYTQLLARRKEIGKRFDVPDNVEEEEMVGCLDRHCFGSNSAGKGAVGCLHHLGPVSSTRITLQTLINEGEKEKDDDHGKGAENVE